MKFQWDLLRIRITETGSAVGIIGWQAQPRINLVARLYFITAGSGWLECQGRRVILSPGHFYFIPAQTQVSQGADNELGMDWMHWEMRYMDFDFFQLMPQEMFVIEEKPPWLEEYRAWCRKPLWSSSDYPDRMAHSWRLLGEFLRSGHIKMSFNLDQRGDMFQKMFHLLEHNPGHRYTVEELARCCGMSRCWFSTEFRRIFGSSPSQYLLSLRLNLAREMLQYGDENLEQIAGRLQFSSAFHFSRTFKQNFGISPSEFRSRLNKSFPRRTADRE